MDRVRADAATPADRGPAPRDPPRQRARSSAASASGDTDRRRARSRSRRTRPRRCGCRSRCSASSCTASAAVLNVYYTSDERLDLRDFVRDVGSATGARIELRQLGVRDEAKVVGGIGSCGLDAVLHDLAARLRAGLDQDGQGSGPRAVADQGLGPVRPAQVLPGLRAGRLRRAAQGPAQARQARDRARAARAASSRSTCCASAIRVSYGPGERPMFAGRRRSKPMFPPGTPRPRPPTTPTSPTTASRPAAAIARVEGDETVMTRPSTSRRRSTTSTTSRTSATPTRRWSPTRSRGSTGCAATTRAS